MIKEGERWMTRNGEIFTIFSIGTDKEFPIIAINDKKRLEKFTRDGYLVNKTFPKSGDLVTPL
jgi:hypothetical protein